MTQPTPAPTLGYSNKPELPAKTDKARISSKELIEKQKNWIQHFKGSVAKPAVQAKPASLSQEVMNNVNRINSEKKGPISPISPVSPVLPVHHDKDAWVKERTGLLSGWMASPSVPPPIGQQQEAAGQPKEGSNMFLSARQRFEAQSTKTTVVTDRSGSVTSSYRTQSTDNLNESFEMRSNSTNSSAPIELNETDSLNKSFRPESAAGPTGLAGVLDPEEATGPKNGHTELLSTDSGIVLIQSPTASLSAADSVQTVIEEALEKMDLDKEGPPIPAAAPAAPAAPLASNDKTSSSLNSSSSLVQESEEVFYDNSVTSARFDEWQLRTPTQLDDSPVYKSAALDFDALVSDGDEAKQLEPDEEELFRTSSELSETDLSPISSPPPPPELIQHTICPAPPPPSKFDRFFFMFFPVQIL